MGCIVGMVYGMIGFIGFVTYNDIGIYSPPTYIFMCMASIAYIPMNIIGIIELAYQFPGCKHEIKNICILVVVNLIINLMGKIGFYVFGCVYVNRRQGYVQV